MAAHSVGEDVAEGTRRFEIRGGRGGVRVFGGIFGGGAGEGREGCAQGVGGQGVAGKVRSDGKKTCKEGGIVRLYAPFSRLCPTARATISENGIRSNASRTGLDPEGMRQQEIACARRPSVKGPPTRGGPNGQRLTLLFCLRV